jgi:hypothetical protein
MWAKKKTKVFSYNFQENVLSPQMYVPNDLPVATHYFNLNGTITVTTAGTTVLQNTLWPVLCNLMGLLTWQGRPNNGLGTGRQINGIPFLWFWLKSYTENSVAPINNGTTLPGAITATTYNVNFTIPISEFDPKWSDQAQGAAIYRGARYGRPYWSIQAGQFAPVNLGNPDVQAYITTAGTPAYTYNLTMTYSVDYVTNLKMSPQDPCLDYAVEYLPSPSFGANLASVNGINLSLQEFQARIDMLNTTVAANGQEVGVNNLAINNGGQMDTRFGGTVYDLFDGNALIADDQSIYFSGGLSWPVGVYTIDQCSRSTVGMKKAKTFIGTAGTPYIDTWAGAIPAGSTSQSLRLLHYAPNLSASFKKLLSPFGPWGG